MQVFNINMRIHSIKIIVLFVLIMFIGSLQSFAQTAEVSVVFVLNKGERNKITQYLYRDLKQGLMHPYDIDATIEFVNAREANEALFTEYDVVVVVDEMTSFKLFPFVQNFIDDYQEKKNMIVIAFFPNGNSRQSEINQQSIDILSSASEERTGKVLVNKFLAKRINDILFTNK